jgi:hypothetical protein
MVVRSDPSRIDPLALFYDKCRRGHPKWGILRGVEGTNDKNEECRMKNPNPFPKNKPGRAILRRRTLAIPLSLGLSGAERDSA